MKHNDYFKNAQQAEAYKALVCFALGSERFDRLYDSLSTVGKLNQQTSLVDTGTVPRHRFTLNGSAGVGKTWLIKGVIEAVMERGLSHITLAAMTNQAKSLLEYSCKGLCKIQTLHQLYKLKPFYNDKGDLVFNETYETKKLSDTPLDLLIIDEASQYDMGQYEAYLPKETRIVYLADECQTPPIGKALSDVFNYKGITLTRPVRYNDTIANPLSKLRAMVKTNHKPKSPVKIDETYDPVTKEGTIYKPMAGFKSSMFEDFKSNPLSTIALCYTNNGVDTLNRIIKENINPSETVFSEGDICVCGGYTAQGLTNGDLFKLKDLKLGLRYKGFGNSNKSFALKHPVDLTYGSFTYKGDVYKFLYEPMDLKILANYRSKLSKLKQARKVKISREFEEAYSGLGFVFLNDKDIQKNLKDIDDEFTRIDNEFTPIKLGYAMTVHKSQGQGFDNVYVYSKDINTSIKTDPMLYIKLNYTACSRAKKKLVLSC